MTTTIIAADGHHILVVSPSFHFLPFRPAPVRGNESQGDLVSQSLGHLLAKEPTDGRKVSPASRRLEETVAARNTPRLCNGLEIGQGRAAAGALAHGKDANVRIVVALGGFVFSVGLGGHGEFHVALTAANVDISKENVVELTRFPGRSLDGNHLWCERRWLGRKRKPPSAATIVYRNKFRGILIIFCFCLLND